MYKGCTTKFEIRIVLSFHTYRVCDYVFMLRIKLTHVSKMTPGEDIAVGGANASLGITD